MSTRNLRPKKSINYFDMVQNKSFKEKDANLPSPFKNNVKVVVKKLSSDESGSDNDFETNSESSGSESDLFSKPKKAKKSVDASLLAVLTKSKRMIDDDEEENEYRRQRQKNMADRLTVLRTMDIEDDVRNVVSDLNVIQKISHTPKPKPKPKHKPKVEPLSFPRRKQPPRRSKSGSHSFQDYDLEENQHSHRNVLVDEKEFESRILEDNLSLVDQADDNDFLKRMKQELDLSYDSVSDFNTCDFEKFSATIKSCCMYEEPCKIIKSRITSLEFHPSEKNLLLLAGDKLGNICLWNIARNEGITLQAHDYNVNCVSFSSTDSSKFYSTSLDGTTRKGDINKNSLDLLYSSRKENPNNENHTTWHEEAGNTLLIARGDGVVKFLDMRDSSTKIPTFKCHPRSTRTVEMHPSNEYYFLTSSGTGTFGIWDVRNMKSRDPKAVVIEDLGKALTSAFYSHTGSYVLTTSNDDTIRIYDCRKESAELHVRIPHNNHGGRWLSVFKARWQPEREDCFYVGSMLANPKRLQAYNFNGRVFHEFTSPMMETYSPVVSVHPSKPIIVGGNGSGKIHVFSPFNDLKTI